jgi:hypothetical protein
VPAVEIQSSFVRLRARGKSYIAGDVKINYIDHTNTSSSSSSKMSPTSLPPPPVYTHRGTSHGSSNNYTNPLKVGVRRGGGGGGGEQDELSKKLEALLVSTTAEDDVNGSGSTTKSSSATSSPFSVAKYLNLALSNEALQKLSAGRNVDMQQLQQAKMAELALQLQLESQKCHNVIEQIGMDLNAILPRCDSDVVRLKGGLDVLRQDASHLHKESQPFVLSQSSGGVGVGNNTAGTTKNNEVNKGSRGSTTSTTQVINAQSPPLELLTTLHALKKNLALTKSILSAASSWDATVSTIPSLLSPPSEGSSAGTSISNLMEAVQALSTLDNGARALRGLPGVEERDEILSAVRSKIEVLLRPKLLHALQQSKSSSSSSSSSNTASLGALQQVASMYKLLGKTEMLQTEYVKARPAAIHKSWFAFKSRVPGSSSRSTTRPVKRSGNNNDEDAADLDEQQKNEVSQQGQSFVTWTQEWYDSILTLLSEERRRTMSVFGADMSPEIIAKVSSVWMLMTCEIIDYY